MNLKIILKNELGSTDVSQMVSEVTWSGSESEVARMLELSFLYPLHDHYAPKVYPDIGDKVFFYVDNQELFRGTVYYNERLSEQGTIQITCYDDAIRLAKSRGTYNFKGKTAEAITQTVCNDLGITIGSVAKTGISQKLLCSNMGMYEIIQEAYAGAGKQNKKKYSVVMREGRLCVDEVGKEVLPDIISADTNILESSYSLNAENVINRVKIYDEEDRSIGMIEDKELQELVGIFQDVYTKEKDKQAGTVASNILKGIDQSIEVTTLGDISYTTGNVVKVEDLVTKAERLFYILEDSHKWSNNQYTTSLQLSV